MELINVTWKDVEKGIEEILKQIDESGIKYDFVYGLPRGGLVAAVILSHRLDIPMEINLESVMLSRHQGKRALIVDDISDTGKTLRHMKEDGYDIATLYVREHTTETQPKYKGISVDFDNWLLFPWESPETTR